VSECAQGICNTWKKNAVCMVSSWVSRSKIGVRVEWAVG